MQEGIKARKSKYLKSSWRGSPRKATRLIRNGLAQLNYYNKMLSELYIQTSKESYSKSSNILDNRINHS